MITVRLLTFALEFTTADIERELRAEEDAGASENDRSVHDGTEADFLITGVDIELQQYVLTFLYSQQHIDKIT